MMFLMNLILLETIYIADSFMFFSHLFADFAIYHNTFELQAIAPYYITLFFMPPPDLWPPEGGTDMLVMICIIFCH